MAWLIQRGPFRARQHPSGFGEIWYDNGKFIPTMQITGYWDDLVQILGKVPDAMLEERWDAVQGIITGTKE